MPKKGITGKLLKARWAIPAKHVLYKKEGTWYMPLTKFPGALCDQDGYVLFPTERSYRSCPQIKITQKHIHCRGGIRQIPGYMRRADDGSDLARYEAEFHAAVAQSLKLSSEQRASRLGTAQKNPERIAVTIFYFRRNPDVVAQALVQANGVCQACRKKALFVRQSDGTPYLEVHHKLQLADGGEDVVGNAIALCPNCHRKAHFGAKNER